MKINSSELRELDVVNVCTGKRLGYVCDFVIDSDCGKITALNVSETFFTLSGGKNTLCVPFEKSGMYRERCHSREKRRKNE